MNDMVDRTPRRRVGRTRDQPVETRRVTSLTSNRLIAAIGEQCDFIDDRIRHAGNETVGELRWVNLHHAVEPRLHPDLRLRRGEALGRSLDIISA